MKKLNIPDDKALLVLTARLKEQHSDGQATLREGHSRLWIVYQDGSADRIEFTLNYDATFPGLRKIREEKVYPFSDTNKAEFLKRITQIKLHELIKKHGVCPNLIVVDHYTPEEFSSELSETRLDKAIIKEISSSTAQAIVDTALQDQRDKLPLFSYTVRSDGVNSTYSCLDYQLSLCERNGVTLVPNREAFVSQNDIHRDFYEEYLKDFPLNSYEQVMVDAAYQANTPGLWKEVYTTLTKRLLEGSDLDLRLYNPPDLKHSLPRGQVFSMKSVFSAIEAMDYSTEAGPLVTEGVTYTQARTDEGNLVISNSECPGYLNCKVSLAELVQAVLGSEILQQDGSTDKALPVSLATIANDNVYQIAS